MKTKAKSSQVFEVRIWSKKYFGIPEKRKEKIVSYEGCITDCKTKEGKWFRTPAQFLTAIENLFIKAEKKK